MEESWARTEMAGVEVWDQRCRGSLERICEQVLARPEESFSAACGPGLRQAGSRIFGAQQMSVEKMLAGHVEQTAQRCQAQAEVIVAQDTTDVNYTTHKGASGLGPINGNPDSRGLLLHTALALTTEGVPLGVLSQESWARDPATFGTAAQRRTRPVAEKESQKWLTGLQRVAEALPEGPRVVLVQDREADVFAFLAAPRPAHIELIVRVCQPRRVEVEAGARGRAAQCIGGRAPGTGGGPAAGPGPPQARPARTGSGVGARRQCRAGQGAAAAPGRCARGLPSVVGRAGDRDGAARGLQAH